MSKKGKKIILVIFIALCVFMLFSNNIIHAAINEAYLGADSVPDTGLDKAVDDSEMIKSIAKLIFAVGRFLENILGNIFLMLTGIIDFPWADKIVFNSVPLLDVNFINPAKQSFVITIQSVLQDIYSTILTLAGGFFGIAVLITAIKLVISSIAAEKAKYKKALTSWVIGFVMMFCIHYFISFVFYLNEQLVNIASKIVTVGLEKSEIVARVKREEVVQQIIEEAQIKGYKDRDGDLVADVLRNHEEIVFAWVNYTKSEDKSHGIHEALMRSYRWYSFAWDALKPDEEQYKNLALIVKWAADKNVSVKEINKIREGLKLVVVMQISDLDGSDMFLPSEGLYLGISEDDLKKMFGNHYQDLIQAIYASDNMGYIDMVYSVMAR